MDLLRALRLSLDMPQPPSLALVGGGGKSAALFALARQWLAAGARTVLITTTTHLGDWQAAQADVHWAVQTEEQLRAHLEMLPAGVVLLTGPKDENQPQRLGGMPPDVLRLLDSLRRRYGLPLLIEADGSRSKPLKAPAEHEPAIPDFVEMVVVVAGLRGLGRPLGEATVHRPELFAALAGLEDGEVVTAEALRGVLTHPQGGLKNIPPGARRVALLNQADTPERQAAGGALAQRLLTDYDAALVAALDPQDTPEPFAGKVFAAYEPAAGILLAAGASTRYGQPKQLLEWQGEALVRRAARIALEGGLSPVVVVTGAHAEQVRQALAGLEVSVVENPAWQEGQAASLRAGLSKLPASVGAAVFLLADQPLITPTLVRGLLAVHRSSFSAIVAPLIDGQRGNPVLFDRVTFPDLLTLQGDQGGRALFSRYPVAWLPWHDTGPLRDVDTPADYRALLDEAGEK